MATKRMREGKLRKRLRKREAIERSVDPFKYGPPLQFSLS